MIREHPVVERGAGFNVELWPEGLNLDCIGPWTSEANEVLRSGRARGLTLSYTSGIVEQSLDFIEDWPLEWVIVIDRTLKDISPLQRLGQTVRSMTVHADVKASLDLSCFPRLEYLDSFWSHVCASIGRATSIRELSAWNYSAEDMRALSSLVNLEQLDVRTAMRLRSLEGLEGLGVKRLGLGIAPKLEDVSAIEQLHLIEELVLESCRAVSGLGPLTRLGQLRRLRIINCGRIESLKPLAGLGTLEELVLAGDTTVVDGDLRPLSALPALRTLRTTYRRHYNMDPAGIALPD